jgi:hypothetical protein
MNKMSVQIWTDSDYVYVVTSSGLEIYDLTSQLLGAAAYDVGGYNSVWSGGDYIYVGTFGAGIKRLYKPSIIIDTIAPTNINDYITNYFGYPDITSDTINYIHGNYNKLLVCTTAGIDIVRTDSLYITHHTTTSGDNTLKCFATETNNFYYTISGIDSKYYIHRLNYNTSDWYEPDYIYITSSGVLNYVSTITDFYVSTGTSISGSNFNTLFLATDVGIYVIDEGYTDYITLTTI